MQFPVEDSLTCRAGAPDDTRRPPRDGNAWEPAPGVRVSTARQHRVSTNDQSSFKPGIGRRASAGTARRIP